MRVVCVGSLLPLFHAFFSCWGSQFGIRLSSIHYPAMLLLVIIVQFTMSIVILLSVR